MSDQSDAEWFSNLSPEQLANLASKDAVFNGLTVSKKINSPSETPSQRPDSVRERTEQLTDLQDKIKMMLNNE